MPAISQTHGVYKVVGPKAVMVNPFYFAVTFKDQAAGQFLMICETKMTLGYSCYLDSADNVYEDMKL